MDVDVTFVASQPGAGSTMLLRRNRHLAGGAWLDEVAWTSADAAASRRLGPPPVRVNPNDPNMVLRTYFPEPASGSPLQGARSLPHPWNAALASTRPGRKIAAVEDLDAFLNISLDGDDEETGADGRRADREGGKKDKGLVGRPGRVESVYNASVVGGSPTFLPSSHVKCFPKPPPMFAPPPYAHRHKMGLALGFKAAGGDDKFQVAIKSLTTDSETLKISARPGDTVETLLRRVRKKWTDVRGRLEAYFPEGEHGKAHVAACEAAKAEGRDPPRATPLDERATLEQCGVKRRVPEPLVYVVAPECFLLDESVVSEQRPAAVAAAQTALARAMGEENPEAEAAAGANTGKTAEELAAAAAAVTAADPAEAVANAITKPSDLSATNGRIILVQYAECNPPLIAKPGMGAKRVTYYRRRTQGDTSGRSLTQGGPGRLWICDRRRRARSSAICLRASRRRRSRRRSSARRSSRDGSTRTRECSC